MNTRGQIVSYLKDLVGPGPAEDPDWTKTSRVLMIRWNDVGPGILVSALSEVSRLKSSPTALIDIYNK